MNMPGFTGDASLYQTNNSYWSAAGSYLSPGSTTVTPQACRWYAEAPICTGIIAGGAAVCAASCIAGGGPLGGYPCYLCWTAYLGALYGFCRDCLPAWIKALIRPFEGGGDDGGQQSCCPPGTICSCGGHCVVGLCTGPCLPPGAPCPITPPRPIDCEVGEKCCERDADGNCELCIPHNAACP
jgi:hypothetical protein